MHLIRPESIPAIDSYAIKRLGVSEEQLIRRAGEAVAKEIAARYTGKGKVLILCGGGNNGADGYATALALRARGIFAIAADVFGCGQRSEGGRAVLAEYVSSFGAPLSMSGVLSSGGMDVIVDAVLGSGAKAGLSDDLRRLLKWVKKQDAFFVAVDIPLGVDATWGELEREVFPADLTVVLSFYKQGLFSYPARAFCGEMVLAELDMGDPGEYSSYFSAIATDAAVVKTLLPRRDKNSHKGSFGRLQAFAGSHKYRGAAQLVSLGALRMGVGLMQLSTEEAVAKTMGRHLPELLYDVIPPIAAWTEEELLVHETATERASAVLVGPGSCVSEGLYRFLLRLVRKEGAPLLLDADALGSIAAYAPDVDAFFATAARPLVLTPHPLEFARLIGLSAAEVQAQRMRLAVTYAKTWGVSLLLKGAGTVITDGERLYINTTGSSALAKGGSGDVLSGTVGAFLAAGVPPLDALATAAYLHGAAGDMLAKELSEYGVIPSDLPLSMAKLIPQL